MRKWLLLLVLILVTPGVLAQDGSWRDRGAGRDSGRNSWYDNSVELTPFVGYTWGGSLNQSTGLSQNADVESSANFGLNLGIPVGNWVKLDLLVDRQNTNLTSGGAIFGHNTNIGDFDVTYYQAGVEVPFSFSRSAIPYMLFSAGVANLDPKIAGTASANRFSGSIGFGVKVPLSRNAGLRFEGRGFFTDTGRGSCHGCYYYGDNNELSQGQANVGVYFRF